MKYFHLGHILRPQGQTKVDKLGQAIGGTISRLQDIDLEAEDLLDQKIDALRQDFMNQVEVASKELCLKWLNEWQGDPKLAYAIQDYLNKGPRKVYMPKKEKKILGIQLQEETLDLEIPPLCGSRSIDLIIPEGIIIYDQNYWHHCNIFTWINGKPFIAGWR